MDLAYNLPRPIDCVVTDPPYGISYKSNMATTPRGLEIVRDVENDGDLFKAVDLFLEVMEPVVELMADDSDLYVFTRWDVLGEWLNAVNMLRGITAKMALVWAKGDPGMGDLNGTWGCGHEFVIYAKKGRRPVKYRRSGVIHVDRVPAQHMVHPTEKPVALLERLIDMSTDRGDLVVDPFAGSGTSVLAARNLHRRAIGIELEEAYVEVGRKRLAQGVMAW